MQLQDLHMFLAVTFFPRQWAVIPQKLCAYFVCEINEKLVDSLIADRLIFCPIRTRIKSISVIPKMEAVEIAWNDVILRKIHLLQPGRSVLMVSPQHKLGKCLCPFKAAEKIYSIPALWHMKADDF